MNKDSMNNYIKQKIYEIKNSLNIWSSNYNEKKDEKIINNYTLKQMLTIIIETSKFLPLNEIPKMLCLLKSVSKKVKKNIQRVFTKEKFSNYRQIKNLEMSIICFKSS